jgi:hypothetical protein
VHDLAILTADNDLLVRAAKPARRRWIVERVIGDHSMHFEHKFRRQR